MRVQHGRRQVRVQGTAFAAIALFVALVLGSALVSGVEESSA